MSARNLTFRFRRWSHLLHRFSGRRALRGPHSKTRRLLPSATGRHSLTHLFDVYKFGAPRATRRSVPAARLTAGLRRTAYRIWAAATRHGTAAFANTNTVGAAAPWLGATEAPNANAIGSAALRLRTTSIVVGKSVTTVVHGRTCQPAGVATRSNSRTGRSDE